MATKSKAFVDALFAAALACSASCAIGVTDDLGDSAAANIADPGDEGMEQGQDASADEDDGVILDPIQPDASGANRDGGTNGASDAGAKDAAAQDASHAQDASQGALDAGSDASAGGGGSLDASTGPNDAGASASDAGTDAGRDAGSGSQGGGGSAGGGRSCDPSSCESCLAVGPFPCCHDNGTCGCTWAPGAYCL